MSRKKIAPTLREVMGHQVALGPGATERVQQARRELRALIAVAKAAQSFEMHPDRLRAAVARLDRASKETR